MLTMSPKGIVDRIVRAWSTSGKARSSRYFARPVTFSTPSLRRTLVPTVLRTRIHGLYDWSFHSIVIRELAAARTHRAGRPDLQEPLTTLENRRQLLSTPAAARIVVEPRMPD